MYALGYHPVVLTLAAFGFLTLMTLLWYTLLVLSGLVVAYFTPLSNDPNERPLWKDLCPWKMS